MRRPVRAGSVFLPSILFLALILSGVPAAPPGVRDQPRESSALPVRRLAKGVYAVLGDTGRGSEGRPNAGFIVTGDGVIVVDALASPRDGEALVGAIERRDIVRGTLMRGTLHLVSRKDYLAFRPVIQPMLALGNHEAGSGRPVAKEA